MADEGARHGKTLFIRNLPYSTTNDELEKVFSDIGPLKTCFVVKDKDSTKCRGFGYVKFTMLEDAEKAVQDITSVNGRKVHIMYSNKKEKKKKFGVPKTKPMDTEKGIEFVNEPENKTDNKVAPGKKLLPKDGISEVKTGQTSEKKADIQGKTKFQKSKMKEKPVKGKKQEVNPKTEGKRARLIIRNLAFKCTSEALTAAFKSHGDVIDVHIPKKNNKSRMGFAFIQMANKAQAGMAIKALNGKQINGRNVAVDWALPKDKFEAKQESKAATSDSEDNMEVDMGEVNSESSDEEKDANNSEDEDNSSEEGESEDDSNESEDDSNESEDESEEEKEDVEEKESSIIKTKQKERPSDVEEGKTLFVRNLPFSVNEEDLIEFFSEYGDVKYAKLVVDKASGMPRGSAFVQFKSKEFTDKCLEASGGEGGSALNIGGRDLYVSLAVSRQKAVEIIQKKDDKKEKKDTRNLYLAREGMIRAGTEAAKGVSEADLLLRTKIDAAKRRKLKDQNVFVSSVRLCVHNLPATITDKQLRKVCLKAAGDKAAKITECRIMRDLERPNAEGVGKSRGYAFCSFSTHEHAMNTLRCLNNNAEAFGDKKRPIVEFSLENRKALEAKEKRLEKSKARLPFQQKQQNDGKTEKKKRRKRKLLQGGDAKPLTVMKQQDKVARSIHGGKPLGLPSHSGPKQRHKPRPMQQFMQDNKKNKKLEKNKQYARREREERRQQVPMQKSNKRQRNTDNFDRLVASYKQKIMRSTQNVKL